MAESAKQPPARVKLFRNDGTAAPKEINTPRRLRLRSSPNSRREPPASFGELGAHDEEAEAAAARSGGKAVNRDQETPPKLFLYSIAGAVVIILLVVGFIAFRIHSENPADESSAALAGRYGYRSKPASKPAWKSRRNPRSQAPAQAPARYRLRPARKRLRSP